MNEPQSATERPEVELLPLQQLTISRRIWARGQPSKLLSGDDMKLCCVGIYLRACGVADDALAERRDVDDLMENKNFTLPPRARWLWTTAAQRFVRKEVDELYLVNDSDSTGTSYHIIGEEERERALVTLFRTLGNVEVAFAD